MIKTRYYLCIDLKSFFASVEAVEAGLNPLKDFLVVADPSRGKGALCLAVSPAFRELGIPNRCRIMDIPNKYKYTIVKPRMKKYIEYACDIYSIYLKYISKDDIHVYSIDESFIDITDYLSLYETTPYELAKKFIDEIYQELGLIASAGIGTNLFLAKLAMDLIAKNAKNHIAFLDEESFKQELWEHKPITDIWMISRGTKDRLAKYGVSTLKGITNLDVSILKKEFGINHEILLDHAYGKEPTTIQEIKNFKSKNHSLSNGQILVEEYSFKNAQTILLEMVDLLSLELVERHLNAQSIFLRISYVHRQIAHTGGSANLICPTNIFSKLKNSFLELYERTTSKNVPIKAIYVGFGSLEDEAFEEMNLFINLDETKQERKLAKTIVNLKQQYGKNSIIRGFSQRKEATAKKRNKLIGGHNAE